MGSDVRSGVYPCRPNYLRIGRCQPNLDVRLHAFRRRTETLHAACILSGIGRVMSDEGQTPLPPNTIQGRYANYFRVGHNAFEFIADFGQSFSEDMPEQVHTRIITSPVYAKELLRVLQDAVEKYERTFGEIQKREHE